MQWNSLRLPGRWVKFGACALAMSLSANLAWGAKIRAQCVLLDKENQVVQGLDIHHAYEIASVSKIFTSYWAAATRGIDYRFKTKVYITPVSKGVVDVHLEGGWDPYFNRDQMQYLLTQLSSMNVSRISHLTFDENFKFLIDSRGLLNHKVPTAHYQLEDPTPNRVQQNLKALLMAPSSGYAAMRVKAKSISDITLPPTLKMKISSAKFLSRDDFHSNLESSQNVREMLMRSVPLSQILKEMNRNSNNYVANLIFQSMGGAKEFQKFILKYLKMDSSEVLFVNGSGDRLDLADGASTYNKASCDAIVKTIAQFRENLHSQGAKLEDILAMAGEDVKNEKSTVSSLYDNEATADALIAKTGTVDPAVTLAGMASTEEGDVYFGFIYGTDGAKSDWNDARKKIRKNLVELFKKHGNKKEITYDPSRFMAFDQGSRLHDVAADKNTSVADATSSSDSDSSSSASAPSLEPARSYFPSPFDTTVITYDDIDMTGQTGGRLP